MKKVRITIIAISTFFTTLYAFGQTDTTHRLEAVTVQSYRLPMQEVKTMRDIQQNIIVAGKKNAVIDIQNLPANLAEKTGRQIFAKIPGVFVYDMDGSGNQVNIATRGLDPHRSWEYNVRQNGIMTNSDIYGYPASHYSAPMESIQRVELIHGTASLQYGSQFGGMINYVTKQADTTKIFGFESLNSLGSFGLMSTFNAISGTKGKFSYYAYAQKRLSNGYRKNARSEAAAQYAQITYAFSKNTRLKLALGRSTYLFQVPGPLTDAMFEADPRQATRSRNYFSPDIYLPSFTFETKLAHNTDLEWVSSAVLGNRSSLQFIGFADAKDTIEATTRQYKTRQVDIDNFNSYTNTLKIRHNYRLKQLHNTLIGGVTYMNNDLHRRQLGVGTTGTDYDLTIKGNFGRDIHLKTQNWAFFAENLFRINQKWQVSAGFRLENGASKMSGAIVYLPSDRIPQTIAHRFPLFGISSQYQINKNNRLYGGISQAYRPVIFSDLIPASVLERNDPDLKDAFGHNAELGLRGKIRNKWVYDINIFQILYKNRIGSLILTDANGQSYIWKTNIGDSRTNGVEMYAEYKALETETMRLAIFTASSFFDGVYLNGKLRNGNDNIDLTNKRLETVPRWISRNGLQYAYKQFSAILQYSYVDESYSDALNTEIPSANGARGRVPAYAIWDFNTSFRISNNYTLRLGINNMTNKQYFTKRPSGYPGQGVWSSDGRSIVASFGIKI